MGLSPSWQDTLEEGMATHSSITAWRISWTEQSGGLQSIGFLDLDICYLPQIRKKSSAVISSSKCLVYFSFWDSYSINVILLNDIFFSIYFYQLEANYFTILQWVLSYIDMNQPWSYMYSHRFYFPIMLYIYYFVSRLSLVSACF